MDRGWTYCGNKVDIEWTGHMVDRGWTEGGHRVDIEWTHGGHREDTGSDTGRTYSRNVFFWRGTFFLLNGMGCFVIGTFSDWDVS